MRKRGDGTTIGRWVRGMAFTGLVACGLVAIPAIASAQVEVTGVIGGMLGGDLDNIIANQDISVKGAFDNGPLYGVRVGWIHGFVGAEGSFVYSPTGVSISVPTTNIDVDASTKYYEANFLLIPIPGPVSPFFTIGAGWHSYDFDLTGLTSTTIADLTIEKAGWNIGGGIKINIKGLTLRGDIKDHITKIGPSDFRISDIADELGITNETNLHNVEISGGVGIRF